MVVMKPQQFDSPVRYHSLEQPKVSIWAVIGIFAVLVAIAVVIIHHV
jgi:type IV secretory pathway component VirB8